MPNASFRLALESASTPSTGVRPWATSHCIIKAEVVVFPTPPFPATAIVKAMTIHPHYRARNA